MSKTRQAENRAIIFLCGVPTSEGPRTTDAAVWIGDKAHADAIVRRLKLDSMIGTTLELPAWKLPALDDLPAQVGPRPEFIIHDANGHTPHYAREVEAAIAERLRQPAPSACGPWCDRVFFRAMELAEHAAAGIAPAGGKGKRQPRAEWLAKAMLEVQKNPHTPDKDIANAVGISPTQLSRDEMYQAAAMQARCPVDLAGGANRKGRLGRRISHRPDDE